MSPEVGDRVPAAEAVVADALRAFESQQWEELVELTDSTSVRSLRANYLAAKRNQLAESEAKPRDWDKLTQEAQQELSASASFLAGQHAIRELAGIQSLLEAEALGPADFLVRFAQARHPEFRVDGTGRRNTHLHLEPRVVVGSVAVLPDKVAVMLHESNVISLNTLGEHSLVAVVESGGEWRLDASRHWL